MLLSIRSLSDADVSQVLGVDVSPMQPTLQVRLNLQQSLTDWAYSVPPNVKFEIMDVSQSWLFTYQFDFIFSRFMTGAIANWRQYLQECFE